MALVTATCTDCGRIELRSRDIRLRCCQESGEMTFLFRCPVCRMMEVQSAEQTVADTLIAVGCQCEIWQLPQELYDSARRTSVTLTHDDVLDFVLALRDADTAVIIGTAVGLSVYDQQKFLEELRIADSRVIARELNA